MADIQIAVIDEKDTQIALAVPGIQGPAGAISSGGSANQVFYKVSGTNYDAGWTFIGNANVDAAAAIAGTKISPNFGSQATVTTGTNTAASFIPTSATIPSNGIYLPGANQVAVATNGVERVEFGTAEVVFNDGGENYDFRVESDLESQLFFIDASDNSIGVGTAGNYGDGAILVAALDRATGAGTTNVRLGIGVKELTSGQGRGLWLGARTDENTGVIGTRTASGNLAFETYNGSWGERMRLTYDGKLGIGTSDVKGTLGLQHGNTSPQGLTDVAIDALRISQGAGGIVAIRTTQYDAANQPAAGDTQFFNLYFNGSTYNYYERMRIRADGRVGIGVTSPNQLLQINSTSVDARIQLTNSVTGSTNNDGFHLQCNNSDIYFDNKESGNFIFQSGANEAARIDSSRRLLVGTPSARVAGQDLVPHAANAGDITLERADIAGLNIISNRSDQIGAALRFGKSTGDAIGSNAIVGNNNRLGTIQFCGADGTDMVSVGAQIEALVDGTPGANDMPGRLVFSTTPDNGSSPTERMRINSSGAFKASTGGSYTDATSLYNEFYQYHNSMGLFIRCTNASQTASVLELNGDRTTTNASYSLFDAYNGNISGRFSVRDSGNAVNTNNSYGAISDIKLKENIVDANSQWDDLKALQVRNYNFKEGQTHTQIGLVAQEAELVSPGIVSESPDRDGEGNDLGTVTKSVNYSVLYMKAVKALQEAMERIETLEQRLTAAGID